MKKTTIALMALVCSMMMATIAATTIDGQAQVSQAENERLAAAWPTIVYMTSNQTFFKGNQTPCSVSDNITGVTALWSSEDNSTIYYAIWIGAENITQVTMNLKQNGSVGPAVVQLYAQENMTRQLIKINQTRDLFVIGNFTAGDLIGPMKGMPMSSLRDNVSEGNISIIASTSTCPMELRGEFGVLPFLAGIGQDSLGSQLSNLSR